MFFQKQIKLKYFSRQYFVDRKLVSKFAMIIQTHTNIVMTANEECSVFRPSVRLLSKKF